MLYVLQLLRDFVPDPLPGLCPWTPLGVVSQIPSQLAKPAYISGWTGPDLRR